MFSVQSLLSQPLIIKLKALSVRSAERTNKLRYFCAFTVHFVSQCSRSLFFSFLSSFVGRQCHQCGFSTSFLSGYSICTHRILVWCFCHAVDAHWGLSLSTRLLLGRYSFSQIYSICFWKSAGLASEWVFNCTACIDRLKRSTDVMIGGLNVIVCGYGDVSFSCYIAWLNLGQILFIFWTISSLYLNYFI